MSLLLFYVVDSPAQFQDQSRECVCQRECYCGWGQVLIHSTLKETDCSSKRNIFLPLKPLENQVETVSAQFLARISWAFISLLIPSLGFWRSTGQTWIISEVSRTPQPFSTRHNKLALGCLWQKFKPTAGTWCPLHHTAEEHHLLWASQLIFKVGKMSMHLGYLSTFRLGDDGK